jgi:hypothetical protein
MLNVKYSKHARERMVERGISKNEISKAIQKGQKRTQNGKLITTYTYFEVVYKKIGEKYYIITVQLRW